MASMFRDFGVCQFFKFLATCFTVDPGAPSDEGQARADGMRSGIGRFGQV